MYKIITGCRRVLEVTRQRNVTTTSVKPWVRILSAGAHARTHAHTHEEMAPFVWGASSARLHRVHWPQGRLVQFVASGDPDKAPIFGDMVYDRGACRRACAGCSDFSEAIFVAWRRRKHDKNVPQALGLPNVPLRATAASTAMTPGKMATSTCQLAKSAQ